MRSGVRSPVEPLGIWIIVWSYKTLGQHVKTDKGTFKISRVRPLVSRLYPITFMEGPWQSTVLTSLPSRSVTLRRHRPTCLREVHSSSASISNTSHTTHNLIVISNTSHTTHNLIAISNTSHTMQKIKIAITCLSLVWSVTNSAIQMLSAIHYCTW